MSRKSQIKEYFSFTKGEKKGIIFLLILIFITVLINQFSHLFTSENQVQLKKYSDNIKHFEKSLAHYDSTENNKFIVKDFSNIKPFKFNPNTNTESDWKLLGFSDRQINTIKNWQRKGGKFKYKSDLQRIYGVSFELYEFLEPYIILPEKKESFQNQYSENQVTETLNDVPEVKRFFDFNPNLISDNEWLELGFTLKQISVIRNYLSKGGVFNKKEDLKKIYGINEFQYERVKDYINIPDKPENHQVIKIDLNNFSEEEFIKLGGFWKNNAGRIVKYRKLLGGFSSMEQLSEVYGVKAEYYTAEINDIYIDTEKIVRLNINFAEKTELIHPYLSYTDIDKIIDYRNKNGAYKNISDLKEKSILSIEIFNKIKPYLTLK